MTGVIHELIELLSRLPGIGRRTAMRLAFHLLKMPKEYAQDLGSFVATLHEKVLPCSECRNLSENDPCSICSDTKRDQSTICVVAGVPDLWAIEESGAYRGLYHVLHGLLAPLDGVGPDDLHIDLLKQRVLENPIAEVVIATRPSVEGEATALLIRKTLEQTQTSVTRIASGISYGSEIEFADRMTLGRALEGRREIP